MTPLDILRVGAITPLGLSAPPTCAAFRAGLKALARVYHPPFPAEPITGATVPASARLRRTLGDWLANLATRALAETFDDFGETEQTALIINLPDFEWNHSQPPTAYAATIVSEVQKRVGRQFALSEFRCGGHAGALSALARARDRGRCA